MLKTPEDEIEFAIARLELKPGDVLVARTKRPLVAESVARLRAYLERCLSGTKVLIIDSELELSVVTKADGKRLATIAK